MDLWAGLLFFHQQKGGTYTPPHYVHSLVIQVTSIFVFYLPELLFFLGTYYSVQQCEDLFRRCVSRKFYCGGPLTNWLFYYIIHFLLLSYLLAYYPFLNVKRAGLLRPFCKFNSTQESPCLSSRIRYNL